jgi:hypothetical protein
MIPLGFGELAVPLTPRLGLGLGDDLRAAAADAGVLRIEVVADERDQQPLAGRTGLLDRSERLQAGPRWGRERSRSTSTSFMRSTTWTSTTSSATRP